jgi:hypothetical protein
MPLDTVAVPLDTLPIVRQLVVETSALTGEPRRRGALNSSSPAIVGGWAALPVIP